MNLKELIQTVVQSDFSDWNKIDCWGAFSGPSYKNNLEFYNIYEEKANILHVSSHSTIASFKKDLSITIAYGLSENDDYKAPWANEFTNPKASSHFIDLFYNNALVFRETYLAVDGGRCILPIPSYGNNQELVVVEDYYKFIKRINELTNESNNNTAFDLYFQQTRIEIDKTTPWII